MFRHLLAIVRFSLKYLVSNYTYNACVRALMERSLVCACTDGEISISSFVGRQFEKLHCRPVKQDEAAANLGYGVRSLILDKRAQSSIKLRSPDYIFLLYLAYIHNGDDLLQSTCLCPTLPEALKCALKHFSKPSK
jgi:hypothetical protein